LPGASRSTIKARLNELIKGKQLNRYGKGRSTWYNLNQETLTLNATSKYYL
jgi:hypothetical protein